MSRPRIILAGVLLLVLVAGLMVVFKPWSKRGGGPGAADPRSLLIRYAKAVENRDRAEFEQCLAVRTPEQQAAAQFALVAWDLGEAKGRLHDALTRKFGAGRVAALPPDLRLHSSAEFFDLFARTQWAALDSVQEQGDRATGTSQRSPVRVDMIRIDRRWYVDG